LTSIFPFSLVKYFIKKIKLKQLFYLKALSKGITMSKAGSVLLLGKKREENS